MGLQDKLGMQTTLFEIYDRTGVLLRNDQDLRDAVQAGRTPLHGTCDSRFASEIEWVCRQIGALKCDVDSQKQESRVESDDLRHELSLSIESARTELRSQLETAKKANIQELDRQRQEFKIATDQMRQELMHCIEAAKQELAEIEIARKTDT